MLIVGLRGVAVPTGLFASALSKAREGESVFTDVFILGAQLACLFNLLKRRNAMAMAEPHSVLKISNTWTGAFVFLGYREALGAARLSSFGGRRIQCCLCLMIFRAAMSFSFCCSCGSRSWLAESGGRCPGRASRKSSFASNN